MTDSFYQPKCPVTFEPCLGGQKCVWGCWIQKLPAHDRAAALEAQRKAAEHEPIVGMIVGEWKAVEIAVSVNGQLQPERFPVTAAFVPTGEMVNFEIDRPLTFEFSKAGTAHIHVFRGGAELLVWQLDDPVAPGNAFKFGPSKN